MSLKNNEVKNMKILEMKSTGLEFIILTYVKLRKRGMFPYEESKKILERVKDYKLSELKEFRDSCSFEEFNFEKTPILDELISVKKKV